MSANEITCPVCGAAAGAACTNPLTGEAYRHYAPHLERIRASRVSSAEASAPALLRRSGGDAA